MGSSRGNGASFRIDAALLTNLLRLKVATRLRPLENFLKVDHEQYAKESVDRLHDEFGCLQPGN